MICIIWIILGRQGSGKTLFLIKIAYEYYLRGKNVYSNIKLNFPYKHFNIIDVINCDLSDGVVVLDEIHQILPARASMSKTSRLIVDNFMSQLRKQGVELYGSSQTERKYDVRVRDETDFLCLAKKFCYFNDRWNEVIGDVKADVPTVVNVMIQDMISGSTVSVPFHANPYFNLYYTKEIVKMRND